MPKVRSKEEKPAFRQGLVLHHSKGQHLLINPHIIDSIVEKAGLRANDVCLEIGPGTGNLTVKLLERCQKVIAVELDPRMVIELQKRVSGTENGKKLQIIQGDILSVDLPSFSIVVANIPYSISSPLIFRLLSIRPLWRAAVLLIQYEFAQRLVAKPGDELYCRLTVNTSLLATTTHCLKVGKGNFRPPPQVDSSVVRIEPRHPQLPVNYLEWDGMTRVCFMRKNKTMGALFKNNNVLEMLEKNYQTFCSLTGKPVAPDLPPIKDRVVQLLTESGFIDKRARTFDLDDFIKPKRIPPSYLEVDNPKTLAQQIKELSSEETVAPLVRSLADHRSTLKQQRKDKSELESQHSSVADKATRLESSVEHLRHKYESLQSAYDDLYRHTVALRKYCLELQQKWVEQTRAEDNADLLSEANRLLETARWNQFPSPEKGSSLRSSYVAQDVPTLLQSLPPHFTASPLPTERSYAPTSMTQRSLSSVSSPSMRLSASIRPAQLNEDYQRMMEQYGLGSSIASATLNQPHSVFGQQTPFTPSFENQRDSARLSQFSSSLSSAQLADGTFNPTGSIQKPPSTFTNLSSRNSTARGSSIIQDTDEETVPSEKKEKKRHKKDEAKSKKSTTRSDPALDEVTRPFYSSSLRKRHQTAFIPTSGPS
ncbi:putative Ribosomal RNA small subunit methyltransferase [Blattamonas nauphoetae]|uniref:rRNA adenine N(6)-methyltransferase n=1 Tax=Blattamonas nauphoetae TaxID=2049346 RepID=A0ABQ9XCJ5_9EUKA|nr:putative Ribosomal RNA small subunit methyltransferase [Blattamonas nauphoetae]